MTRYAIILDATHGTFEFRTSQGFYNKQVNDLQRAGYDILKIAVDDSTSLMTQLQSLPKSSVNFIWLRMHGSSQSMKASQDLQITVNNIGEIFSCLPDILDDKAIIFLDSCSTGALKNVADNLQFAFAKLTVKQLNVQIVAPSKDLHVSYFSILDDGSFRFEMQEHNRSSNIAVILGHETKTLLNNNALESLGEDELVNSLSMNIECPFLEKFKQDYSMAFFGSSFDLTSILIKAIKTGRDSNTALKRVRELIEEFYASPNYPQNVQFIAFEWNGATPLSTAIHYKFTGVVTYLLSRGADLHYTFNERCGTLLEYAKERDNEEPIDDDDIESHLIALRRTKENDNSKLVDAILAQLNSVENLRGMNTSYIETQRFWSSPREDIKHPDVPQPCYLA